jgi:xanthine dehydrogenase YagT iron-sulfur-binding subunit
MQDRNREFRREQPRGDASDGNGALQLDRPRTLVSGSGPAAETGIGGTSPVPAESDGAQRVRLGLQINGQTHELEVDTRSSLLDLLRERLQLTGTKKGCNAGACGACTILLNGRRINACLTLAAMHEGADIVTIEGLADGERLHPLQAAFIEHDAFQCGYCTPGQIMSGVACIQEGHAGSPAEIRAWMSGNICRCGAYSGILDAIRQVGSERT